MWSSKSWYTISCVLRDQAGNLPPFVEIFHLPPGPGNGRTKTSFGPYSFGAYPRNFPSGENAVSTPTSLWSAKNGSAFPPLGRAGTPHTPGRGTNALGP